MLLVVAIGIDRAGNADDAMERILQHKHGASAFVSRFPDTDVVALIAHVAKDAPRIILDQPTWLSLVIERGYSGDISPFGRTNPRGTGIGEVSAIERVGIEGGSEIPHAVADQWPESFTGIKCKRRWIRRAEVHRLASDISEISERVLQQAPGNAHSPIIRMR